MSEDPTRYGKSHTAETREALHDAGNQIGQILSRLQEEYDLSGFSVEVSEIQTQGGDSVVSHVRVRASVG